MMLDYIASFSQIARRDVTPGADIPMVARYLNEGKGLRAACNELLNVPIRGLQTFPLPSDEPEPEDELDCTVIIHRDEPEASAALVERRMTLGERVVLIDLRHGIHADPELVNALLATTVYLGNLAAYDIDLERAIYTAMIPVRDGTAFRTFLTHHLLYWWAWEGIVRAEVQRRFGPIIADNAIHRAEIHARTRIGAHLVKVQKRGLRCHLARFSFHNNRVDRFYMLAQVH